MGLKNKLLKKNTKPIQLEMDFSPTNEKLNSENIGDKIKPYLQSYLYWLNLQNPKFTLNLSNEELVNYFIHDIDLPNEIDLYIKQHPLQIISKIYEYIDMFKDKTSLFHEEIKIVPKKEANYKKGD